MLDPGTFRDKLQEITLFSQDPDRRKFVEKSAGPANEVDCASRSPLEGVEGRVLFGLCLVKTEPV
jgi:hypothetical protein